VTESEAKTDNERRPEHEDEQDEVRSVASLIRVIKHVKSLFPQTGSDEVPDLCEGHFDDVTYIKGNVYVVKENFIWQFNEKFELDEGFPMKTRKFFPNLPKRLKKIDALYEIPEEGEIVFFTGTEYITYDSRGPIYSSYNITRYTNDPDIKKVDAAMTWGENNRSFAWLATNQTSFQRKTTKLMFSPTIASGNTRSSGRWRLSTPESWAGGMEFHGISMLRCQSPREQHFSSKASSTGSSMMRTSDRLKAIQGTLPSFSITAD
jgi:Hemopexin